MAIHPFLAAPDLTVARGLGGRQHLDHEHLGATHVVQQSAIVSNQ